MTTIIHFVPVIGIKVWEDSENNGRELLVVLKQQKVHGLGLRLFTSKSMLETLSKLPIDVLEPLSVIDGF